MRSAVAFVAACAILAALPAGPGTIARFARPSGTPGHAPAPGGAFLSGVVEGFYGPPWSVANTRAILQFEHAHGMNAFVYAPKFDPYELADWRALYPPAALDRLRQIITAANADHVAFIYSISPGHDITYSAKTDRLALLAKIDQLRRLGVHAFMLSLDDIPGGLDAADNARYHGRLAEAECALADYVYRVERAKDPAFRLLLAQTRYYGAADNSFWATMRRDLSPQIDPIWTGNRDLSNRIAAEQVAAVERDMGHRVVIWCNYPVNDFTYIAEKRPKLFLGPLRELGPHVPGVAGGILFNPMLQARASEIALWTEASYLHNPSGYAPRRTWHRAIRTLGGKAWPALTVLAQNEASYNYGQRPPTTLSADIAAFWRARRTTSDLLATPLAGYLVSMANAAGALAQKLPSPELAQELAPWAAKLSAQGRAGLYAVRLFQEARTHPVTPAERTRLAGMADALSRTTLSVGGDAIRLFLQRAAQVLDAPPAGGL